MTEELVRREQDPDTVFGKTVHAWPMVCVCVCTYEHIKFCVGMRGKQYSQFISSVSFGGCRMFIAGDRIVISCGKRVLME